jgi:hypothetical protein
MDCCHSYPDTGEDEVESAEEGESEENNKEDDTDAEEESSWASVNSFSKNRVSYKISERRKRHKRKKGCHQETTV